MEGQAAMGSLFLPSSSSSSAFYLANHPFFISLSLISVSWRVHFAVYFFHGWLFFWHQFIVLCYFLELQIKILICSIFLWFLQQVCEVVSAQSPFLCSWLVAHSFLYISDCVSRQNFNFLSCSFIPATLWLFVAYSWLLPLRLKAWGGKDPLVSYWRSWEIGILKGFLCQMRVFRMSSLVTTIRGYASWLWYYRP